MLKSVNVTLPTFAFFSLVGLTMAVLPAEAAGSIKVGTRVDRQVQSVHLISDSPGIKLVMPENGGTYTSPVGIEIDFEPKNGATVDLETLKVTVVSTTAVGVFEIDITEDIIDYASEKGIKAPKAEIPAGEHVVTIQVADSEKRTAERQLSITVREESVLERRVQE